MTSEVAKADSKEELVGVADQDKAEVWMIEIGITDSLGKEAVGMKTEVIEEEEDNISLESNQRHRVLLLDKWYHCMSTTSSRRSRTKETYTSTMSAGTSNQQKSTLSTQPSET